MLLIPPHGPTVEELRNPWIRRFWIAYIIVAPIVTFGAVAWGAWVTYGP